MGGLDRSVHFLLLWHLRGKCFEKLSIFCPLSLLMSQTNQLLNILRNTDLGFEKTCESQKFPQAWPTRPLSGESEVSVVSLPHLPHLHHLHQTHYCWFNLHQTTTNAMHSFHIYICTTWQSLDDWLETRKLAAFNTSYCAIFLCFHIEDSVISTKSQMAILST